MNPSEMMQFMNCRQVLSESLLLMTQCPFPADISAWNRLNQNLNRVAGFLLSYAGQDWCPVTAEHVEELRLQWGRFDKADIREMVKTLEVPDHPYFKLRVILELCCEDMERQYQQYQQSEFRALTRSMGIQE